MDLLEFQRNGIALLTDDDATNAAVAYEIEQPPGRVNTRVCTCKSSRSITCPHLKMLAKVHRQFSGPKGHPSLAELFAASLWHAIATILAGKDRLPLEEKIAAIIAKKRSLMESIVKEDDSAIAKSFSREDLLAMMAEPAGDAAATPNVL